MQHYTSRILIPKMGLQCRKLTNKNQVLLVKRMELLKKSNKYDDAVESVLNFMPALSAYVQMLTVSGSNPNRKDQPNDFYDRELLVYGLSYSTVFAAFDGWIASLVTLTHENGYPGFFKFVKTADDLSTQLAAIS